MNSRARLTYIILTALFLCLALSILSAHLPALGVQALLTKSDAKTFIIAARRSGDVEFIDPVTLETVSRIHIDVNPKGVGLNGISVSEDGSTIYLEGPNLGDDKNVLLPLLHQSRHPGNQTRNVLSGQPSSRAIRVRGWHSLSTGSPRT